MFSFRQIFSIGRLSAAVAMIGVVVVGFSGWRVRAQAGPVALAGGLSVAEIGGYEQAAREHLGYLPNQVLVKFKDGVTRDGQQKALMALRSRPDVNDLKWVGNNTAVATDLGQSNGDILAEQLREQPEVLYAQPNYLRHVNSAPNDPSYASKQWDMAALDMPRAWDINPGAKDIIVAIVDTGVTNVNQTFSTKTWNGFAIITVAVPFIVNPDLPLSRLVLPRDFATGFGTTILDTDGHGTHVSGTVGEETNNGVMLAGMAYNTKIMPVKVCVNYWDIQFAQSLQGMTGFATQDTFCPDSATVPGIRYAADNGAKVINFSIGGAGDAPALRDAISYAVGKGTFVAMSAGNSYDDGNPTEFPAKYGETIEGAMAVGSVGRGLRHAYYSTSGSYVEIAAPGGDEREAGEAGGIWQSTIRAADSDPDTVVVPRFDRFEETSFQGTSMASPHVAGLAALLFSQLGPSATPALVEQMIKKSARPCGASDCIATNLAAGRNDFFGAGLIQPRTALFGSGLRK